MTVLTARELLKRHNIAFMETRSGKYTTQCQNCSNGYLNVKIDREGVAWFCHSCDEGGGEKYDQPQKSNGTGDLGPIKEIYDYPDESGKLLFQALRFEPVNGPKQFRQRTGPDQKKWSIKGVRVVPFMLPELHDDLALGHVIFVVEGEKDVLTLRSHGVPATCNPMGAGKWWPEFNEILRGADVVICGDNDQPGRDHVDLVARNLVPVVSRLRVLELAKIWPGIEQSDDITDWFKAGGRVEALWETVEQLSDFKPTPVANGNGHEQDWEWPQSEPLPPLPYLSKSEFIDGYLAPNYQVDGMLQKLFLYAVTGQTGHAKTAIALFIAEQVASPDRNAMIGRHRVEKGRVVYFVGENADDIRMRVIGADSKRTDDPANDRIHFIPGVFDIDQMYAQIVERIQESGGVDLVIVDTSAAYFLGDEENNNAQMGKHARKLRKLTELPGGPCVLVLCHPTKTVLDPDYLLPRGGGAFLAEVDGNLTVWKHDDSLIRLHHNKMRGPGFEPITFQLEPITTTKLVDSKNRLIPTVRAVPITSDAEEQQQGNAEDEERAVLAAYLQIGAQRPSIAEVARHLNWSLASGEPYKSKVQRVVRRLIKDHKPPRLSQTSNDKYQLTEAGKTLARDYALHPRRVPMSSYDDDQDHLI